MKSLRAATWAACIIALSSAFAFAGQPNIVLIFVDDMGYGDIGPFGNKVNKTPHLDRMATEGHVLRNFYVSNTACTPSRAALMTGTYASRIGMDGRVVFPGERKGLHPDEITMAELLKGKGYATGCFGKWHLGDQPGFMPLAQGFDEYFGIPYSNDMWPGNTRGHPDTKKGYTPLPIVRQDKAVAYVSDGADQSLLCEAITDEAVKFIKKHKDGPFFCYLPHAYVHNPRYARPKVLERAEGDVNRANVEEVDDSVGRVLATLRELGIAKNTLVLFTSDNGGAGGMSMGPLRGGKGGPKYEGHMRVPTIAWWPGTVPAGTETDAIATTTDLFPSFAKLVGAQVPKDRVIDGKDALDVLLGKPGAKSPHETHYYEVEGIRRGKWKLVVQRRKVELFDLDADPGERKNLAAKHPDRVAELKAALAKHAQGIAANVRPAGSVETAKPIISEPGDLPRLREFMGMPNTTASNGRPPSKAPAKAPAKAPSAAPVVPITPIAGDLLFENSDFETGTLKNWTAEGDAFTVQPTQGDNPFVRSRIKHSRHQGDYWIGTFERYDGKTGKPGAARGDKPTGTLTSAPFTVKKSYIVFRIGGGARGSVTGARLLREGKAEVMSAGFDMEEMKVVSFDASAYVGKTVRIQVYDKADKHWGHVNADDFRAADKPVGTKAAGIPKPGVMDAAHRTFPSYLDVGYDQPRRPQFHFTSRKNWLNDPNGMVHYDGEYHLYFQHHALGLGPGKKSWGHAVSKDMVHWEQLPHAILPYSGGAIWSGTAVVDHNNSLGKQVGDTKTIVAFFTLATRPKFFQAAAYSTDRGRTFTLVKKGEAVVPNQMSVGERDPKVFWHAAGKKWVMVLWVGGGRPSTIRFFTSDNMVDWTVAGDIKRAWAAECMDFVELPVDGDAKNKKWVLYDASFDYEVGTYDGNVFRLEGETHKGDLGSCFYAAQTFNNSPDARTVMIGWMREKKDSPFIKAGMPFNQAMSFPTTMELRTTPDGIRLYRWPVKEIDTLVVKSHTFENLTVASAAAALAGVKAELVDLSIAFEPAGVETMDLTIRGLTVTYDKAAATFTHNKRALPAPTVDGLVKLRVLVDRASIELFANEGAAVATHYAEPAAKDRSISIAAKGALKIKSLVVNELKSAW